jgi:AcrR family transcriptional regulator
MPRPSRQLDQALLASGRELYPQLGAAALSVRALAEHAGVNAGMFHYHFESKDAFLRTLLQQLYEEMFAQLSQEIALPGAPLQRLRQALAVLGRFLRTHGAVIGRIWADAGQGEPVAREFMQANAPRHIGLLLALFDEAERAGDIVPMPPMQRFTFVLGAVAAPVLVATRVAELGVAPKALRPLLEPQVLSDAAILARADLALAALRTPLRKDDHA